MLYDKNGIFAYAFVTEKFGTDLRKYCKNYSCIPGMLFGEINDDKMFEEYFPLSIPENIRSRIKQLVFSLKEIGYEHLDLHCGNLWKKMVS